MKKALVVLLTLALLVMAMPVTVVGETAAVEPVKYVVPGDAPAGYNYVMGLVNEKLTEIGVELSIQYIPWDVWDQKLNLMLSTGEDFDLFHVMQDRVSYSTYYSRGALKDITEELQTYGESIFATIPANIMDAATISGKYYAIPTNWVELGVQGVMQVRLDILNKYGLSLPTTSAEILDVVEAILAQDDSAESLYIPFRGGSTDPSSTQLEALHPEYDRYPFTVKDALFFVGQDGTVESWYETEEFKMDCKWMEEAYNRGLIDPDVLSITQEQISDKWGRGIFAIGFGTGGSYTSYIKEWPEITKDDVILHRLNPEKGALRPWAFKNGNSVPVSSKNPAGAVKFVNWLYSSQENYDLFLYGVNGVTYTVPEEGAIETIALDTNDEHKWSFADWMIGNMSYIRLSLGGFPAVEKARYTVDETAMNCIAGGFFFDPTEVQTEYSNVQTELAAAMVPICLGVQPYDEYFDAALARLKAAGLDTVVEAYKTQFTAYQDATK